MKKEKVCSSLLRLSFLHSTTFYFLRCDMVRIVVVYYFIAAAGKPTSKAAHPSILMVSFTAKPQTMIEATRDREEPINFLGEKTFASSSSFHSYLI